jgi:aspartate 1-decarboxylase
MESDRLFKGNKVFTKVLKSKIHRARVTETNLEYAGSITIDQDLTDAVGLREHELVLVANINNGTRHETYVQLGKKGSKVICMNGAAARLACPGDRVIIMGFGYYSHDEQISPVKIVVVDQKNQIIS